jgi:hypothetical protein
MHRASRRQRRLKLYDTYPLLGMVLLPFLVAWVHLQFFASTTVYPQGDLAIIDYDTRLAMHGHLFVGMYDRFATWHHPGPALFELYAAFYWVFGSSASTLYAAALMVALVSSALVVIVIRRRTDEVVGRASVVVLGLILIYLTTSTPGTGFLEFLTLLTSPWNPDIVIVPTLLFVVLAAAALDGAGSMAALLVVGSVLVQADVGVFPLVGAITFVVVLAAVVRALLRRRRSSAPATSSDLDPSPLEHAGTPAQSRSRLSLPTRTWVITAVTAVVLIGLWILPLYQQVHSGNGNLSAIASFFRTHRVPFDFQAAMRPFSLFALVLPHLGTLHSTWLFGSTTGAWVVFWLSVVLLLGALATSLALRLPSFSRRLLVMSALGLLVSMYAGTSIYGLAWGYLLGWTIGVLVAGVLAIVLIAVSALTRAPSGSLARTTRRLLLGGSVGGAVVTAVVLGVQVAELPALASVTNPAIKRGTLQVERQLSASDQPTQVVAVTTTYDELAVEQGIVNQLDRDGVRLSIDPRWFFVWGNGQYGANGTLRPGPYDSVTTITVTESKAAQASTTRRWAPVAISVSVRPATKAPRSR